MSNRFPRLSRCLALLLVVCGALGALGCLWWQSVRGSGVSFLPRMSLGEWIVYPCPPQGASHPQMELGTAFRCGFVLKQPIGEASLQVAGFHRYTVSLNGQTLGAPVKRGRNWKE